MKTEPRTYVEMSPIWREFHVVLPSERVFCMFSSCAELNLLLEPFHVFENCFVFETCKSGKFPLDLQQLLVGSVSSKYSVRRKAKLQKEPEG
jgi:hypothetical protein